MHRHRIPLVALFVFFATGALAQSVSAPTSSDTWAKILNPAGDLAERRALMATAEANASVDDPHGLYVIGSLFERGEREGGVLAQADPDKASLYFGNAALHGDVSAMASLAELKLAKHDYREAMNWAQIYAHYQPRDSRARNDSSYMAELIKRIADKLGLAAMTDVMRDVDSFIVTNDAAITAGMRHKLAGDIVPTKMPTRNAVTPSGRLVPIGGIAAFLVAFAPDGTVRDTFLVDAAPSDDIVPMLRKRVMSTTAPVSTQAVRYAWIQMIYSSGRYR